MHFFPNWIFKKFFKKARFIDNIQGGNNLALRLVNPVVFTYILQFVLGVKGLNYGLQKL